MSAKNIGDFSVKCENKTYRLPYNILHNEIRYIEKYKENFNRAQVVDVTQLADLLTFETILQYNGRAHINIHNQNIVDLVNGCCSFNDKSLLANCIKFISKSISAKELNKLLENREKYKDYEELIKTMNSFCKKHIIYLINDENIYYWSRKSLKYILCLLDLHIRDENYLANQIIKYYNSQSISNKDGLDDWFNNIKSKINWKNCDEENIRNSSVDKLLNFDDYHIDSNNRININSQVKEPNIYKSDIYWKETNENGMFSSYDIEDKIVEFVLNDERFCAIENVIKYRNDYLYTLIEENRGNINNNKIVVPLQLHMKNEIFKELMVLYGFGRVILDENNILELMSACIELEDKSFNASFADYFDLRKTTSLLNSYLLDHDKYSNFFPEVEEVVRKYVYNNIIEITNHVLSPKSMKEVLSFNLLYVVFEQTLADNIVRYINHCQNHNISIYLLFVILYE